MVLVVVMVIEVIMVIVVIKVIVVIEVLMVIVLFHQTQSKTYQNKEKLFKRRKTPRSAALFWGVIAF